MTNCKEMEFDESMPEMTEISEMPEIEDVKSPFCLI